jgi:3-deoxy-7-phosphoheptulonate synthase
MLVVMKQSATPAEIEAVVERIEEMGYGATPIPGGQRTAVGLIGNDGRVDTSSLQGMPGVLECIPVTHPYKQVSREWREEDTVITLPNGTVIGGTEVALMAGPCSVESEEQIFTAARQLRAAGATILRGGAFKPRTSPYSFQGLGEEGLRLLARARDLTGMAIVTEALDADGVDLVARYADIIQIGARNMQNYPLLRRAGQAGKPILLKRGMSATIEEFLLAAEYILAEGNPEVILCERGVRGFDTQTRNILDLTAIPLSLPTRPTARDSAARSCPWREPPWPRVRTGSWSRCTPIRRERCRTARSRCIPSSSWSWWIRSASLPTPSTGAWFPAFPSRRGSEPSPGPSRSVVLTPRLQPHAPAWIALPSGAAHTP